MATEIEVVARADISDFERKMDSAEERLQGVKDESKRTSKETSKDSLDAFAAILNTNLKGMPSTRDAITRGVKDAGRELEKAQQSDRSRSRDAILGGVIGGAAGFAAGAALSSGPADAVLGTTLNLFLAALAPLLMALVPLLQALVPVLQQLAATAVPVVGAAATAAQGAAGVVGEATRAATNPVDTFLGPTGDFETLGKRAVAGAALGATIGAGVGALAGGVGAAPGAVAGAVLGGVGAVGVSAAGDLARWEREHASPDAIAQWFFSRGTESSRLWENDLGPASQTMNQTAGG